MRKEYNWMDGVLDKKRQCFNVQIRKIDKNKSLKTLRKKLIEHIDQGKFIQNIYEFLKKMCYEQFNEISTHLQMMNKNKRIIEQSLTVQRELKNTGCINYIFVAFKIFKLNLNEALKLLDILSYLSYFSIFQEQFLDHRNYKLLFDVTLFKNNAIMAEIIWIFGNMLSGPDKLSKQFLVFLKKVNIELLISFRIQQQMPNELLDSMIHFLAPYADLVNNTKQSLDSRFSEEINNLVKTSFKSKNKEITPELESLLKYCRYNVQSQEDKALLSYLQRGISIHKINTILKLSQQYDWITFEQIKIEDMYCRYLRQCPENQNQVVLMLRILNNLIYNTQSYQDYTGDRIYTKITGEGLKHLWTLSKQICKESLQLLVQILNSCHQIQKYTEIVEEACLVDYDFDTVKIQLVTIMKVSEINDIIQKQFCNIKHLSMNTLRILRNHFCLNKSNIPLSAFKSEKSILITSALPYVNNVPHLGNIIGCVLSADVFSRFNKSIGNKVLYICGTDEYGTATEVKAFKQKKTPRQICDHYHELHKRAYKWFDINFNYFGRTSTDEHTKIVSDIFLALDKNGFITEKETSQHYCNNCIMYLADRYVKGTCPKCGYQDVKGNQCEKCNELENAIDIKNPKCVICNNQPIIKETKHLYLDVKVLKPQLQKWLEQTAQKGIWSNNAKGITKAWIKNGLQQRSITRDLKWGIPVPKIGYENKVFYVWFDAPIGYISLTSALLKDKYLQWWQNKQNVSLYQFMGKDNVYFHSVIFPSTLLGTKLDWTMVNNISATEYLNYEGAKFSKSNNIGIFCDTIQSINIESFVWRYYLISIRPEKADGNFEWDEFAMKVNNQLMGNLGNLFNRVLTFNYSKQKSKRIQLRIEELSQQDMRFLKESEILYREFLVLMNRIQIREGLKKAMEISSLANKYLQDMKPWEKQNILSGKTSTTIELLLNFLQFLTYLFEPFIPGFSKKANAILGNINGGSLENLQSNFLECLLNLVHQDNKLLRPQILVNQIKQADKQQCKQKYSTK